MISESDPHKNDFFATFGRLPILFEVQVNLIPLIGKADSFTKEELQEFKQNVFFSSFPKILRKDKKKNFLQILLRFATNWQARRSYSTTSPRAVTRLREQIMFCIFRNKIVEITSFSINFGFRRISLNIYKYFISECFLREKICTGTLCCSRE